MAPVVEDTKEGECGMKSVRLNIGKTDEKQIASCIKCIAGNVSESEIVEIVLKTPEPVAASSKESEFLLEGKPRSEYQEYCEMFDQFITGPAIEGREIAELTEKYEKFHEVMKATQLKARENNEIEAAVYGIAIEAEMQGFIYGFKMFNALMNKRLKVAV